jgi:hypothetical protein
MPTTSPKKAADKGSKIASKSAAKAKRTPMKSPREIDDVNAANTATEQPGAANIRPSGNSTNRGSDMTQSANAGAGVENDRSR